MSDWDTLFKNKDFIETIPESIILRFVCFLEHQFSDKPLRIWDFCSGAGRHTIALSRLGHEVYGSDISKSGIEHTKNWLKSENLSARLQISDMTEFPWEDSVRFHAAFSWSAIHHNTFNNIKISVQNIHRHLIPGGYFMCNLLSINSGSYGKGKEIAPRTFIKDSGPEKGVIHHFFIEEEIKELFDLWEVLALIELVCDYHEFQESLYPDNPFPYTKWLVLVKKPR